MTTFVPAVWEVTSAVMTVPLLPDALWNLIEPLLPVPPPRPIGQQRPQTGARQPAAPKASGRRPRTASRPRLTLGGYDRGEVRTRVGVRRSRRAGGPSDGRRLHLDATDALRIRGPRPRGPLLRQHLRRGAEVRPRAHASQRSAGVRSVPARPYRHQPRGRPLRPYPHRRPDLRHDPLRQQRAPMVRATAIAPEPIASFRAVDVRGSEGRGAFERGSLAWIQSLVKPSELHSSEPTPLCTKNRPVGSYFFFIPTSRAWLLPQ